MNDEFNFQWHITNLCNLRCKHCYQEDFSSKFDLEWKKVKFIFNNIILTLSEWNKSTRIDLTGGEPFLKRELFSLLDYLDKSKIVKQLNIITNAIVINRKILMRLKDYKKLKWIKVSLEGLNEISCDQIRGEGVFKKVIATLELLKKEKFGVILMFTVLKRNIDEISQLLNFCYKYHLDGVILERFIPLGRGREIFDQVLEKDEWKKVIELLSSIFPFRYELEDFLPYRAFWIDLRRFKLLGAKCNIGDDSACIMPNADVLPCRRFNLPIGNLLRDPLRDIFGNTLLKELRDKNFLKGKCKICDITTCIGCRAISYHLTGDYFSEDIQCWY